MSREDQYNVTVAVAGKPLGTFDKLEGGEVDSEDHKFKPGGMAQEVSLGGSKSVNNVTVHRLYKLDRDHPLASFLIANVGKGDVVATKQPLDVDGNPFGKPIVYKGKLKQYTLPDHDSTSSSEALFQIEISAASVAA